MLAVILNKHFHNSKEFSPRDLVESSEETLQHLFEVSVAAPIQYKSVQQIFEALVNNTPISDEIKEKIKLRNDEDKWYFNLDLKTGDKIPDSKDPSKEVEEVKNSEFNICKDPERRKLD